MQSRQIQFVGLVPNTTKVAFAKEEGNPSIFDGYNGIRFNVVADPLNQATAQVAIQQSADGNSWSNVLVSDPIVPAGEVDMVAHTSKKYVRVVATSTGVGKLMFMVLTPEEHASVSLWPDAAPSEYPV